jgi:hypothetical protein
MQIVWEHVMLKLFMFYETMFWVWEHVMLKLFMFYEETMFKMISKYLMKCRICLDHMMNYMFWDNLISFNYVQIILMKFKKWCINEECLIDLKVFDYVLRLKFKLCKLFENMSCWKCLCFMKLCFEFENMSCWNCLCFMKKLCLKWFQSIWWNVGFV